MQCNQTIESVIDDFKYACLHIAACAYVGVEKDPFFRTSRKDRCDLSYLSIEAPILSSSSTSGIIALSLSLGKMGIHHCYAPISTPVV
mmetsp:Transcript_7979/g.19695  ORF Transcript_7979/g.19695 Transcript_7979/m.19695 type:complete len:88 (+) Transcript_7979:1854-2117(+)